jgi:hypothetical protein
MGGGAFAPIPIVPASMVGIAALNPPYGILYSMASRKFPY